MYHSTAPVIDHCVDGHMYVEEGEGGRALERKDYLLSVGFLWPMEHFSEHFQWCPHISWLRATPVPLHLLTQWAPQASSFARLPSGCTIPSFLCLVWFLWLDSCPTLQSLCQPFVDYDIYRGTVSCAPRRKWAKPMASKTLDIKRMLRVHWDPGLCLGNKGMRATQEYLRARATLLQSSFIG